MLSKIAANKEPQYLFLLSLLSFIELFIAGLITLNISSDPKNALIFGISVQRLLLVGGIWIMAITVLVAGILARKKKFFLDSTWSGYKQSYCWLLFHAISFALIVWGWISIFCPVYLFNKQMYIFERMQPLSIALGASLVQVWLFFLITRNWQSILTANRKKTLAPLFFIILLLVLGIFIASTKFGLVASLHYWNVPGIPLSSLQYSFIILVVGTGIALLQVQYRAHPFLWVGKKSWLIPALIFICTVLVWGFTPMERHFFSLPPAAPSYQPFPYSDARLHDIFGISILQGYGVFSQGFDKPLFNLYMAILHIFAGYNYSLMTWLQILILAFIPVILFLLGKKFHSTAFGIFLSLVIILRQRNAIVLANKINSVNPKLFMSEEMTLLGVVLFAYLVFRWFQGKKIWVAILCGGCIGATSFFRLNPLSLFPITACLMVPVFWRSGKKILYRQLMAYSLGFLIFLIPCIFSGINPDGKLWLLLKINDVIKTRYGNGDSIIRGFMFTKLSESGIATGNTEVSPVLIHQLGNLWEPQFRNYGIDVLSPKTLGTFLNGIIDSGGIFYRFLNHFLHNFSTSVLSIPNSLIYEDLNELSQHVYWIDSGGWLGDLPVVQTILVFINLVLIAIGLGISWSHHRWAGMIPMVIFVGYSFATSMAMNSGGRYLVPMDWVMYFYYGIAIVWILQLVFSFLPGRDQSQSTFFYTSSHRLISDRLATRFSLAGVFILASLIPIANFVVPALSSSTRNQANVEAAIKSISSRENPEVKIVYGLILYPYIIDDLLTFDFLTPKNSISYSINTTADLNVQIKDGEKTFIVLGIDEKGNSQLLSLYLWQKGEPLLIWKLQQ
jgi:hypothetical protein